MYAIFAYLRRQLVDARALKEPLNEGVPENGSVVTTTLAEVLGVTDPVTGVRLECDVGVEATVHVTYKVFACVHGYEAESVTLENKPTRAEAYAAALQLLKTFEDTLRRESVTQ